MCFSSFSYGFIMMSHCSFCSQWYEGQLVRKGPSSSLPGSPGFGFPHPLLSSSQKQPHMLCPRIIYWACFLGPVWRTFAWCLLGFPWNLSSLISVGGQGHRLLLVLCHFSKLSDFMRSFCPFWMWVSISLSSYGLLVVSDHCVPTP